MDRISRDELRMLIEHVNEPCLSLLMPAHRAGRDTQQDPIRFRNLLQLAEEQLIAYGQRPVKARAMLDPARRLLDDPAFWRHQSDGLALFMSEQTFRSYRLPLPFAESVFVSNRFQVKPLLPLFTGDGHYYILALSLKQVRLLEATRHGIDDVDLGDVAGVFRMEDDERYLRHYAVTGGTGQHAVVVHGQGGPDEEHKGRSERFFREVDAAVRDLLVTDEAPLILAGVGYLHPLYRTANTYPHLHPEGIFGSPEELRSEELHRQAWRIIEPTFLQARERAAAAYRELKGTGRTCNDVVECVPAAYRGQVDVLFVSTSDHRWGSFDVNSHMVETHREAASGDEDLLNLAAVHTILNGGTVYAVDREQMPGAAALAAVLRY